MKIQLIAGLEDGSNEVCNVHNHIATYCYLERILHQAAGMSIFRSSSLDEMYSSTMAFVNVMESMVFYNFVSTEMGKRSVVTTGATVAMAPINFEKTCFGTRRSLEKHLKPPQ